MPRDIDCRGNGIQRDGEEVGILCSAALQSLRRPCETMHVRVAVLCVAERFGDDAATSQRRTEAMGYWWSGRE